MADLFKGTGVALVTPFQKNGTIDFQALGMLIDHVISNGVNYLVALGTTSEAPVMNAEEKAQVLEFVIQHTRKRCPIVCGLGGNNTLEVCRQLKSWKLDEVDGILSVTPYYNKPSQQGLFEHFKAVAGATEKPVILYNVPTRTSVNLIAETTIKLAREINNIVAIKEASPDLNQCMHLVLNRPQGFTILSGDDILTCAQLALGFDGVISVAANCFPSPFSQLVHHGREGLITAARKIHYQLLPGMELLFQEGNPTGVKAVLAQQKLIENNLKLPLLPASPKLMEAIRQFLKTLHE